MNYIKLLEAQNKHRGAELCAYSATLTDIRQYLLSEKFHADPTVQVSDVLRRLEDGLRYNRDLLECDRLEAEARPNHAS